MPRPKTDREKLTLRLPPEVHVRVKACAADNGRSLNAEIVQRLKQTLEGYTQDFR
jgi:predicted HicB family RNase H-like nuclease